MKKHKKVYNMSRRELRRRLKKTTFKNKLRKFYFKMKYKHNINEQEIISILFVIAFIVYILTKIQ